MTEFFPRHSTGWRIEQPHALRRLTLSLPQMALVTGVVLRFWRSYTLTHGAADSWAWVGGTFLVGASFLCLMCALHHANITLPERLDRVLRLVIVTPALHKVNHSVVRAESDSNYSSLFSWWDRVFRTLRLVREPHRIVFGVKE